MSKFRLFNGKIVVPEAPELKKNADIHDRIVNAFIPVESLDMKVTDLVVGFKAFNEIRDTSKEFRAANEIYKGTVFGARVWVLGVSSIDANGIYAFHANDDRLRSMFPAVAEALHPTTRIRA